MSDSDGEGRTPVAHKQRQNRFRFKTFAERVNEVSLITIGRSLVSRAITNWSSAYAYCSRLEQHSYPIMSMLSYLC